MSENKQVPNYIYWNDKEFCFFKSEKSEASTKVINTFDMSYNPNFFEIVDYTENGFKVEKNLLCLGLKKHFKLAWVGNNFMQFRK